MIITIIKQTRCRESNGLFRNFSRATRMSRSFRGLTTAHWASRLLCDCASRPRRLAGTHEERHSMYEIDRKNATAPRPTPAPLPSYEHAQDIAAASFLSWGEHCVECAEPSCFQTCDLYSRRPDGRCRRFTHGIVRNDAFPPARGYGAEISFKKWGILEA